MQIVWTQRVKESNRILSAGLIKLTPDSRFVVVEDSEESILEIQSTTSGDDGVYECQMSTNPVQSVAFRLTVQEKVNT